MLKREVMHLPGGERVSDHAILEESSRLDREITGLRDKEIESLRKAIRRITPDTLKLLADALRGMPKHSEPPSELTVAMESRERDPEKHFFLEAIDRLPPSLLRANLYMVADRGLEDDPETVKALWYYRRSDREDVPVDIAKYLDSVEREIDKELADLDKKTPQSLHAPFAAFQRLFKKMNELRNDGWVARDPETMHRDIEDDIYQIGKFDRPQLDTLAEEYRLIEEGDVRIKHEAPEDLLVRLRKAMYV